MSEGFSNRLISNSVYHLLNFEKYNNFAAAAREAAVRNDFQIVLFSEDFNTVFSVETRHQATIEDAVRLGIETDIAHKRGNTMLNVKGCMTYWGPISLRGEKYYLMLVDNDDNYSQDDIIKLAEILELAMGMWDYSPRRDPTAEFIRALRRGNRALAYSLMQEQGLDQSQMQGVYLVPGVNRDEGLKIIAAFEEKFGVSSLKVSEGDEIAGILLRSGQQYPYSEQDWKDMAKLLAEAGAPKTFHMTGCENLDDLCEAFKVINESEAFIQLIFPYKHSFSKYELALTSNCVSICMASGTVRKQFQDLIKPLKQLSGSKGSQLMETLECFVLDAGLNNAKTARLLGVHANTVQYRIKNIRDLLGVDITGNTIVPGLMIALAVSRIEKEVKSF